MIRFALIGSLLFLSTHQSPAPISDSSKPTPTPEQSATAAPEQSITPTPKHSPAATPAATESEVAPIVAHASAARSQKSSSGGGTKLIYSANPAYPVAERFGRTPVRGSGEFRVTFGPNGDVINVQVVRSTHHDVLDDAAIAGLRRWRSRPGPEWSTTVRLDLKP